MAHTTAYIGGEHVEGGGSYDNVDPSTGTAIGSVTLSGEQEVDRAVADALGAVHLDGFGSRSPHHLSAGERRRVCLAGAIACRPGLLLLDEPSSGLDPRGRRELAALLATFPATTILASHDLGFVAELCPRAIVMDHGVIAADGATASLLADRELLLRHGLA